MSGKTFFISADGNDNSNGISELSAWKSITKVNSYTFYPLDTILFRCGDTFFGQINLYQSNIVLGSYGSGQKPIITGGERLAGWVRRGSFYVTKASSQVKNLFADGLQMTLARYPNSGFILITRKKNNKTFTSKDITQASEYWKGANCRIRTNVWAFEIHTVLAQTGNEIVLESAPRFDRFKEKWGFYLDNKLEALDKESEWYCDPKTDSVYFWAPGNADPNTMIVIGNMLDYGIISSASAVTVAGLEFCNQCRTALSFSGRNVNLSSNKIHSGLTSGIDIKGVNCIIADNIIQYFNGNAIHLFYTAKNGKIYNNTIKNIGMVRGYQSFPAAYGILSEGTYCTISGNYIDSTGYNGIYAFSHDFVQQNIIKNTMITLADGGAIYTGSSSSHVIISNNIIMDVHGKSEGVPGWRGINESWTSAMGIYLDAGSSYCTVKDNTIIRAKSMALFAGYNTKNHTICNNTAYDCASNAGGFFVHIVMNTPDNAGHVITKNVFYPTSSKQRLFQFQDFSATLHSPGVIDSNYYFNSHGNTRPFETLLQKASGWSETYYTFPQWQKTTGFDANSKYIILKSSKLDTIFVNYTALPITINLPSVIYYDLDNNSVARSFTLAPFSSRVLIKAKGK
ncbi:MAG: right-handed parallel beta-helix repeat-containing protein [Bacteroidetes bacterium]|nr:right-handed parallel beta-helix repeat-containing protein [Bacteroidota bacterium]